MKKTSSQIRNEIMQDGRSTRVYAPKQDNTQTHAPKRPTAKPRDDRDAYYMQTWIGKWCSFESSQETRFAGCIISVEPAENISNVSNYRLTVKGRTGKMAEVDLLRQHARIFDTQEQATKDTCTKKS